MAEHAGGRPAAQQLHVVDAVATSDQGMHQREQLAPGTSRAGAVAEVDQLVGGLLDPQPLGQGGGRSRPAWATARGSSKVISTWSSTTWEDRIEKVPPARGEWLASQPPYSQVRRPFSHSHHYTRCTRSVDPGSSQFTQVPFCLRTRTFDKPKFPAPEGHFRGRAALTPDPYRTGWVSYAVFLLQGLCGELRVGAFAPMDLAQWRTDMGTRARRMCCTGIVVRLLLIVVCSVSGVMMLPSDSHGGTAQAATGSVDDLLARFDERSQHYEIRERLTY